MTADARLTDAKLTEAEFWAELDALGEDRVRELVVTGRFSNANQELRLAEDWLRRKDEQRDDEKARGERLVARENLRIARSAKKAAWVAAKAAWVAAITSVIAVVISVFALVFATE